jgi:hypothetical protein
LFRAQLDAGYGDEYDEEEETKQEEAVVIEPKEETDSQKAQREAIAKMQAAKEEALKKARET